MWIESLKKHINDEVAYSPTHKAFFIGLIEEKPQADPEVFLSTLIDKINGAGVNRSRELAKFVGRCLYQYRQEKGNLDAAASLALLNNIITQRR